MKKPRLAPRLPRDGRQFAFTDPTLTKEEQDILISRARGAEGTMRRKAAYAIRFAWKNRSYRHPLAFQLSRAGHQALRLIEQGDMKAASSAIQQAELLYAKLWAAVLHVLGSEVAEKWQGHTRAQSDRAKKPRGLRADSGEPVYEIIGRLAMDNDYEEESAKRVWDIFLGELDQLGLSPHEVVERGPLGNTYVEYSVVGKDSEMKFSTFSKVFSEYRTGKRILP